MLASVLISTLSILRSLVSSKNFSSELISLEQNLLLSKILLIIYANIEYKYLL